MDVMEGTVMIEAYVRLFVLAQLAVLLLLIAVVLIAEWTLFFGTTRCRRAFRCPLMKREVEVEFEAHRFLGFPRPVAVKSCTAFESPTTVECRQQCVDSAFRRRWEFALPVVGRVGR